MGIKRGDYTGVCTRALKSLCKEKHAVPSKTKKLESCEKKDATATADLEKFEKDAR